MTIFIATMDQLPNYMRSKESLFVQALELLQFMTLDLNNC